MHRASRTKSIVYTAAALAVAAALTACGGGGGSSGGSTAPSSSTGDTSPVVKSDAATTMTVACSGCSAVDQNTYAGSGTGIWQGSNSSTVPSDFPIYIKGLSGQQVTLVFTNESGNAVAMPALSIQNPSQYATLSSKAEAAGSGDAWAKSKADIAEFNRSGFARLLGPRSSAVQKSVLPGSPSATYAGPVIGDQRSINLSSGQQRTVQLQATKQTGDGKTVNIWVESTELSPSRVTDVMVARLRDAFANEGGIYDMLVRAGGPLWGPHSLEDYLIPGTGQPIDIFFVNFDQNRTPYGLVGYFWSLNNFRSDVAPDSNHSLSMYMDTETLYLDGERGFMQVLTSLAHEGMHMQNFYRRGVLMGAAYTFDTWLEEMTAMMMEDWASYTLDPSYNAMRDVRFPSYLSYGGNGSYNCSVTTWTPMGASCESYAVNGSFGAYLNRQFGLGFFKSLLGSTGIEDSQAILNAAIKARRAESSMAKELRNFSAAAAGLVPAGAGVADYGMPGRSEEGFSLVGIDPAAFGASRRLPSAVPALLQPLASFPVSRSGVKGAYEETVRVPAGTTLTVVVN